MTDIQPTAAIGGAAGNVFGPAITPFAEVDERDILLMGRQNYESCGYYSFSDQSWEQWQCGEAPSWTTKCNTIGSHFGCFPTVYTTCSSSAQGCNTADRRALCCASSDYPNCATGIKSQDGGDEMTAYICARFEEAIPVYESTVIKVTSDDSTDISTIEVNTDTASGAGVKGASDATTVTVRPTSSSGSSSDDKDDGGSKTPIGPIVGGVVGGVALIAILAFGFWFIRRRTKKTPPAASTAGGDTPHYSAASPMSQPPPMMYQTPPPQQPMQQEYGQYPPYQGSPVPTDPRFSQVTAPTMVSPGAQSSPEQSYYGAYNKPTSPQPTELPVVTDSPPPQELPAHIPSQQQQNH
ncbi:hypothetical protein FALBO_15328 [Fusarium albosuccineum]|uniref:Mid2 domain-containing protein n=1 Tax=Fusarium albosuccineum TaxID=1237068 RepID=A0A8H4KWY7_9HYPO|nr:hypothetical protein FALBO_15328 [Fusarium albosuccineum]